MTDVNTASTNGDDVAFSEPSSTVGARLRVAREGRKMSVAEIAQSLKLGARQVEALERGQWDSLPGNTFIRGFVRNYARLVNVDAAPLMAELDRVLTVTTQQLSVPETRLADIPQSGGGQRKDHLVILFGLLLLLAAAVVYFFMPGDISALRADAQSLVDSLARKAALPEKPALEPKTQSASGESVKSEPVFPPGISPQQVMSPQAVEVTPAIVAEADKAAPGVSAATPSATPPPTAAPPPQAAPAAPLAPTLAGEVKSALHLAFDKESWVEVRGRDGKVLYSQHGLPGSEKGISGDGPYSLIIGYAAGVRLTYRGKPVDLAPHIRGDVARLTLE